VATIDDERQAPVEGSGADGARGPHGWVRVVLAAALGLLAGAVIALLLPREDGPRRAAPTIADPVLGDPVPPPASGTTVQDGPDTAIEG